MMIFKIRGCPGQGLTRCVLSLLRRRAITLSNTDRNPEPESSCALAECRGGVWKDSVAAGSLSNGWEDTTTSAWACVERTSEMRRSTELPNATSSTRHAKMMLPAAQLLASDHLPVYLAQLVCLRTRESNSQAERLGSRRSHPSTFQAEMR